MPLAVVSMTSKALGGDPATADGAVCGRGERATCDWPDAARRPHLRASPRECCRRGAPHAWTSCRCCRARPPAGNAPVCGAAAALIVVESALAVLLVLSGFLLFRSFTNFSGQDLGFDPTDLYTVSVRGTAPARFSREAALASYEQSISLLAAGPGVVAAGGADTTVVSGQAPMRRLSKDRSVRGGRYQVSAGYFDALRTPLLAGRAMTDGEVRGRAPVGILSQSAAACSSGTCPLIRSSDALSRSMTSPPAPSSESFPT